MSEEREALVQQILTHNDGWGRYREPKRPFIVFNNKVHQFKEDVANAVEFFDVGYSSMGNCVEGVDGIEITNGCYVQTEYERVHNHSRLN